METFKEIDIKYYDNSGNVQVRCTVPVTQDALVHYELMQSHYCKLSFKLSKPIYFLLGDFIDTPYGRFELIDLTKVKDNDTIGYSYEIQFDAYYRKLKNKILKYRPNTGSQEATFSLTSKISTHVEVIMKNLSYYAKLDKSYLYDPKFEGEGTDYTYVIDASVDASASKLITYSNASILDAIANIAQTFNCEWWFEGNILHFGTCENTNAIVDFKLDGNIVSMSSSQNQSTYANRVYAFGAARNLPSGYKNDADADITKDGVVEKRLMLPNSAECSDKNKQLLAENGFELKNGYIQVSGLREDQYVEGVTTNDDIYPRNLIKTSNVASYEKDVEDESTPEEGDLIKRTFYRVGSLTIIGEDGEKTGDMAFRKSYILSGKSLHIVFQSGSLNGMDFECEFNPDGVEEILKDKDGNPILKDGKEQINPKSQVFEIVANEDYGRFLPDITLHPKDGDTFVLYNWDSTKLGDTLVSSASNELLTDAIKNLKKSMIDPTTHTCTAEANYSYNQGRGNLHGVGDRVNLYNKGYGDSYRSSRIIGYEFCLDIPYDGAKYYVGEKPSYSRLNVMESKIEELVYNGQSYLNNGGGSGGSSIYIIKSYDKTSPTEYNVYSARAVDKRYLSKLTNDTAEGLITFAKGLIAQGLADLAMGATFGNSAKITELGEAFFRAIKSLDYDNAAEQGFSVEKEKNGKYHAFFTNLTIWGKARFHELEVRKLSYSGGNIYLSGAGSKLIKVVPVKRSVSDGGVTSWVKTTEDDTECVGWKCYLLADNGTTATMNDWQEGDQARCQTMGEIVAGGTYQNVSNKSYWRTIPDGGVSTQNEKIYGTKLETYLDEDGKEQTREVQVELYDGQAFAWIVIGKHSKNFDGCIEGDSKTVEIQDKPAEGDTIVLDGNRHRDENTGKYDKTDRQNVIILETTGEYAPRIACYANISEYKHTITKSVNDSDKEVSLSVFETSPKGGTKINSSRFEWISDDGSTINIINYRGDWVSTNIYHKNDQVNHNNAVWVCVANSGVDVPEEPSDGATYWKKVLSGGKGEKGDDAVSYGIQFSERIATISSVETKVLDVRFIKSVGQQITSGSIKDIDFNGACVVYIDGVMNGPMSNRLNSGHSYLDIYHAFADEIKGKKGLSVELRNSDAIVVASNNFSFVESGEGVVMAYKNATYRPSKPTVEDLSQLSDGWSRTPQKGGSYLKVDNISYGSFDNGVSSSVDSTSKSWTDVTEGGNSWKKSPSGLSDNYGWAIMKVSFSTNIDNSDVKVIIKAYSEGNYDFIQVHALDTEITGSNDLQKKGVAYISGNGIETSYSYHVTTAGQHFFYVSYCKDSSGKANGDYGLFRFDLSDNLVSMPSTVWMSQAVLKDGKAVLPWSTPVQITGDDAYRVEVSPATLVFDTNENGLVDTLSGKYATVTVYKGNQKISANNLSLPSNYETKKSTNVEGSISNVDGEARITISSIGTETISEDVKVSKSSGQISFPIDVFGERNTLMWATVNVQVNVAKFTGSVVVNNKQYESKFEEISTRFNNTPTNKDLTDAESRITQTAREISLSVSEKTIGRRNLLIGSAFLRDDNNRILNYAASIEINSGYQGTNCIRISDDTDGAPHYCGAFWDGSQGGKSVKITKGKKYVISCYCKTNDTNGIFRLEALYTDKQTNAQRMGGPKYLTNSSFRCKSANKWELFVAIIDTTDAEYDYIAFNFFEYNNGNYGRIEAWICRPMVEEGDTYNGWTLSTEDYDYVGGNMLDNTLSLDKSGTLYDVNGSLTPAGFGESTSIYKSFNYKLKGIVNSFSQLPSSGNVYGDTYCVRNTEICYRYNGSEFESVGNDYYYNVLEWRKLKSGVFVPFGLEANKDYVFSFMAKGTGKLTAYFYSPETNVFVETSLGETATHVDGAANFQLTSDWKKYWVHWRPSDSSHKYVLLRLNRTIQSSAGDAPITDCYIAQPKLEAGAVVTEYTERKSDLVDKASLKAAGIEITSDQVILYGNKVQVKNPKENPSEGYDEAAMFQNGKLNAKFINAGDIVAEGIKTQKLEAQNLNVTGNSRLGIFEIHKAEIDERDEYTINGDSIKYSDSYKFPDGKTEAIGAGSFLTYKPMFVRQGGPDSSEYMRLGHQFTEWDDCNISGENKNYLFVGAAARYVCSGDTYSCNRTVLPSYLKYYSEFKPAAYIYSIKTSQDDPAFAIKVIKPEGSSGECTAIQTNAAIRGVFAPNATDIYKDRQIPNGVGVVYCSNDRDMTLTLPDSPVDGQTLIIIQGSSGKVYIAPPNGKEIHFGGSIKHSSDIDNNRFWSGTRGQFNILVFINNAWQLQFVNNRP